MTNPKLIKGIYLIERKSETPDSEPLYYVGKATDIFDRWKQHCDGIEQHIDISIQKYGCTHFLFSILEKVSKTVELNNCETKWINFYKTKYGENKMYNISQTKNINPFKKDKKIENEIIQLFTDDVGRSIYAIAERYNLDWDEVRKIRKRLLKKHGLKYAKKTKNIVEEKSGIAPSNWRGNRMTKSLSKKILLLKKNGKEDKDIANECNISISDLPKFFNEYNSGSYEFAPEIR